VCLGEGGSVRGSTNVIAALGDKDVCALAGHGNNSAGAAEVELYRPSIDASS
jgi:hypothetical protein